MVNMLSASRFVTYMMLDVDFGKQHTLHFHKYFWHLPKQISKGLNSRGQTNVRVSPISQKMMLDSSSPFSH